MDSLPEPSAKQSRGPRASVSAEAFGAWNQKGNFKAKNIPKSAEAVTAISEKLSMAFMFSALDETEKETVIGAMEIVEVPAKTTVIAEGEEGDCLFVVGSGTLACSKIFKGNDDPTFLKTYQPGEAFGELALLYNACRAATIVSNEAAILYKLDRDTFNHIVKDSSMRKREQYEEFLKKVAIFSTMEPYERSKLSDAFKPLEVKTGEFIIKEGEEGNELYLLQEGEAYATKVLAAGEEAQQVMEYKTGDYFGERALLNNEPRAANVVAKSDCKLVAMDRHSVKRLLGPLETLLKRNMEVYAQFATK